MENFRSEIFSSDLQESDDHHLGGVDESLGSCGVLQPGEGAVWESKAHTYLHKSAQCCVWLIHSLSFKSYINRTASCMFAINCEYVTSPVFSNQCSIKSNGWLLHLPSDNKVAQTKINAFKDFQHFIEMNGNQWLPIQRVKYIQSFGILQHAVR